MLYKKTTESNKMFEFCPVTSGSIENEHFFKTTPSGKLEIIVANEAIDFEVGKFYYLDFISA